MMMHDFEQTQQLSLLDKIALAMPSRRAINWAMIIFGVFALGWTACFHFYHLHEYGYSPKL